MYALIQNGVVHELFEADPLLHPSLTVLAAPRTVQQGWTHRDGQWSAPDSLPEASAPISDVSSAQAKIALSRAGFLAPAKETVAALGGEVEIWFTDARTWQRTNPYVAEIGAGLNLSPAEIDDLFLAAALIEA